jgi:exodeoxyribonuclease VII small subunit
MMKSKKITQDLSVSDAFNQLEAITQELQQGDLDLELAIPKFKHGVQLAKLLKNKLAVLENEIQEINLEIEDHQPVSKGLDPNLDNDLEENDDISF